MDQSYRYNSYSWHQSHDQATVLLLVPYDTADEDVNFLIDRNYLVAGVRDQPPIVKGRLYGNIDISNCSWQLEPRPSRHTARERTISSTSTASTHSSYAVVSDPEISSSFAASLESAHTSDTEDLVALSPALSSPLSSSLDEGAGFPAIPRHYEHLAASPNPLSPHLRPSLSLTSSLSSLESLHSSRSGRLLTLHLEKAESVIWPSLVAGPVPEAFAPCPQGPPHTDPNTEPKYNMDPTSLVLIGFDFLDIRKEKEEAFEFFVRAWSQAQIPSAALRLVTHYVPVQTSFNLTDADDPPSPGTIGYYSMCLGGPAGVARIYMETGLLHLDGSASALLSSSYSPLASIRLSNEALHTSHRGESGSEVWRRDREAARKYFECARALDPILDVPILPPDREESQWCADSGVAPQLQMPSVDVQSQDPSVVLSESLDIGARDILRSRKTRKKEQVSPMDDTKTDDDNTWYLYIPGLVGAGTALLLVGVIGALSFSWKKNQSS